MQTLSLQERESFDTAVNLLREKGPVLARPYVDTVKGSAFPSMKELRTAHGKHLALRAFFAFDPQRAASCSSVAINMDGAAFTRS